MFCPYCGTEFNGGKYCPHCGQFVPGAEDAAGGNAGFGGAEAGFTGGNTGYTGFAGGNAGYNGENTGFAGGSAGYNGGDQDFDGSGFDSFGGDQGDFGGQGGFTGGGGQGGFGGGRGSFGGGSGGGGTSSNPRLIAGVIVGLLVLICVGAGVLLFLRNRDGGNSAKSGSGGNSSVADGSGNGQNAGAEGQDGTANGNSGMMRPGEAGQVLSDAAADSDAPESRPIPTSGAPKITNNDITISQSEFASRITKLNTGEAQQKIDVFADRYAPRRDSSLYWDNRLFYTLEDVFPDRATDGKINGYYVTRKAFINAATGNRMEYEIYSRPSDGVVNKIVSIEYYQDHLEITDYYYLDNGKVSFIFVRNDLNYVPSYAVPTKDGQRFYFNNDCMVKWRIVSGGNISNYCIGNASMNENKTGGETLYDRLDAQSKSAYDNAEKSMLNAAYNTYNTVLNAQSVGWITGFVLNEQDQARTDSDIYLKKGEEYLYRCKPAADGSYFIGVPGDTDSYDLVIVTEGCDTLVIYDVQVSLGVVYTYVDTAYVINQKQEVYQQVLQVRDALNYAADGVSMMAVPDAQINIRYGLNARTTDVIASGVTDSLGNCNLELVPGMYTAEVIKSGYDVIYVNIVIRVNLGTVEIHFSPSLPAGEMRIVLSWGATPEDLDSHLFTPYDSALGDTGYHIFYSNPSDAVGDNLDVDDTDSFGPETITIPVVKDGLYKYYVVDYSNCRRGNATSFDMSYSGAVVNVYASNGLVATFNVPSGQSGVIWEVFEIRNGQIIPNQRYYNNIEATDWWYR